MKLKWSAVFLFFLNHSDTSDDFFCRYQSSSCCRDDVSGYAWAVEHLDERFDVPAEEQEQAMVVMSGNAAVAMGAMAAGIRKLVLFLKEPDPYPALRFSPAAEKRALIFLGKT